MSNVFKNLDDLFKGELKDPFFYNLNINATNDYPSIFEKIKEIFLTGLLIHAGDQETKNINIDKVTYDNIVKIQKYMLSVGLDLKYQKIDNETKDYIYRNFLFDIEHLEDLEILTINDWKTGLITNIKLNIVNDNQKTLEDVKTISRRHTSANFFLKIHPPNSLKDFAIFVNKDKDVHVFSFDFAKIGDHNNSMYCKPKTTNGQSWHT